MPKGTLPKIKKIIRIIFGSSGVSKKTDENHDYDHSFLKKNAVKTICLLRIFPDSSQIGVIEARHIFKETIEPVFPQKCFYTDSLFTMTRLF